MGFIHLTSDPIFGKSSILDNRFKHKKLILQIIDNIFTDIKSEKLTEGLLIAIGIVIDILELNSIVLNNMNEFKTKYQILIYSHIRNTKTYKNQDKRDIRRLFNEFEKVIDGFEFILPKKYGLILTKSKMQNELPSSVMYQLEYHALKELQLIKSKVEENLIIIKNKDSILSIKNLLYTLFIKIEKSRNLVKNILSKILLHKLSIDYNIDASFLFQKNCEKEVNDLKLLSKNGIDLTSNKKYIAAFIDELYPYYPVNVEINDKYKSLADKDTFKTFFKDYYGSSVKEADLYIYPNKNAIYPLYLLLLIRTGLNSETLLDWEVYKENSSYNLTSDNLGILSIVESTKKRSNSRISCVLKNDSDEMKYINFYIKWANDIYANSKNKSLFQYFNRGGLANKKIEILTPHILAYLKEAPDSFYRKYEIYDQKGSRINFIDHRLIRKAHNFQEYIKGKQEFERQLKKGHINSQTTQIHYENNSNEWNGLKKHKIAKAQNLLISIFKGQVSREQNHSVDLFDGSIANCKNNKNPTFKNASNLKSNEFCLDWTKCLTQCEQAYVIPKIHGPVIFAWIKFMKEQLDEFINEEHWEKEYLDDYNAAVDTIKYFTQDEKLYCKNEMTKHKEFVKMIFKRTTKRKRLKNA
jgi:hypothetical protein